MQSMAELSTQWRTWIAENVARGCSAESMVAAMVRDGFDTDTARIAVQAVASAPAPAAASGVPKPADYVYAMPRLPAGNRIHTHDRDIPVLLRMQQPLVAVLGNVLSADECDELIRRSQDRLQRSTTVDPARGSFEVIAGRSSEGTFFAVNADPFIARLDRRIAELMNCPVDHGEGLQVLHYRTGGEYRPHFDYFPPDDPGSAAPMAVGGQRVSTLVMYLNDVEAGGATVFPRLGMEVGPAKGTAVYFEYTNAAGQVDPQTLHAGAPVTRGEKWIMTKWMREHRYGEVPAVPAEGADEASPVRPIPRQGRPTDIEPPAGHG